ncbi:MAG: chloramphenicol 3-O phosphotransferase [Mycoplasmataceae bacterium RC_NB112A]|nr:MAG: chloramphenicol 3-O phosphotransferase [Mycoplasmataceae bacterium RC_NB112A]
MDKPKIILLNGCSSAGKTSLVKAIQYLSEEPFLSSGIDTTFAALPAKYFSNDPGGGGKASQGVKFISEVDPTGFPILKVKTGPYAKKFYTSITKIIKQLASDGHNLVIDEVIWERERLEEYSSTLKDYSLYFVKVDCNLANMEEREILRGNRSRGMARWQFTKIKDLDWNYDYRVDTTNTSSFINAQNILRFLKNKDKK